MALMKKGEESVNVASPGEEMRWDLLEKTGMGLGGIR